MDMSAFKLCIPAPIKTIWTCQHSNYAYPPLLKQYGHVSIQIMHTPPNMDMSAFKLCIPAPIKTIWTCQHSNYAYPPLLKQYGHVSIQIMHTRPY